MLPSPSTNTPEPTDGGRTVQLSIIIGAVVSAISTICFMIWVIFYVRRKHAAPATTPDAQDPGASEQKPRPTPVELCANRKGAELGPDGEVREMQTGEDSSTDRQNLQDLSLEAAAEPLHNSTITGQCEPLTISELPGSIEADSRESSATRPLSQAEHADKSKQNTEAVS